MGCNQGGDLEVNSGSHFQYPESDRMGCNLTRQTHTKLRMTNFQYPESDRMGCNDGIVQKQRLRLATFSILNRIEWVVTGEQENSIALDVRLSVS